MMAQGYQRSIRDNPSSQPDTLLSAAGIKEKVEARGVEPLS